MPRQNERKSFPLKAGCKGGLNHPHVLRMPYITQAACTVVRRLQPSLMDVLRQQLQVPVQRAEVVQPRRRSSGNACALQGQSQRKVELLHIQLTR